jgi:O-antigen/teichoic acid export membrane protein
MTERENQSAVGRLAGLRRRYEPQLAALRKSDTAKAGGLAAAMIVNNVIALGSTVVFAHLLHKDGYGSLAALVSYFLILSVAGQAIQIATAREGVLGHLGVGAGLTDTLRRWTRTMVLFTLAMTVVSVLLRVPIAAAVGVKKDVWAAAIGLPAGCMWLELSILRGALQGVGDYRSVGLSLMGEQGTRLIVGTALVLAGLGVTGAYLGTPVSFVGMGWYCVMQLRRYVQATEPPCTHEAHPGATMGLGTHVRRAWAPIAGLIVLAVLQNIDIIAAKHRFTGNLASSYAATAVAAKVLVWVAIGAGLYVVPEVSRRRAAGEDTRPVLGRALGIILVCSIPVLLIFAFGAKPLLRLAFGADRTLAADSLLILGIAFTVLACTYLAVQYMLAQRRTGFLFFLGLVAIAEPVLLLRAPHNPAGFAAVVLAVQAVGAVVSFTLALRRDPTPPRAHPAEGPPESEEPQALPLPVEA